MNSYTEFCDERISSRSQSRFINSMLLTLTIFILIGGFSAVSQSASQALGISANPFSSGISAESAERISVFSSIIGSIVRCAKPYLALFTELFRLLCDVIARAVTAAGA